MDVSNAVRETAWPKPALLRLPSFATRTTSPIANWRALLVFQRVTSSGNWSSKWLASSGTRVTATRPPTSEAAPSPHGDEAAAHALGELFEQDHGHEDDDQDRRHVAKVEHVETPLELNA